MEFDRKPEHKRNPDLERLLKEINELIGPLEARIAANYSQPKYPSVFILGAPRSGSTLMTQWLASTSRFAYPTNLLSRFYGAPYVGALVQQLLTDPKYNFNNELLDFNHKATFSSHLGKTQGALSPNEFWYFWRRFFPTSTELAPLDESTFQPEVVQQCVAELAAIEAAFDKPLAMKGAHMNFNLPFFSKMLSKAVFLHVIRHPFYNMQSLLEARMNYFGDIRAWYSIKPKEYSLLKDMDPYEQIAGQVYYTNMGVQSGLQSVDSSRAVTVLYEEFCDAPEATYGTLLEKMRCQGLGVDWAYSGPAAFQTANYNRLNDKESERLIAAYKKWSGIDLTL